MRLTQHFSVNQTDRTLYNNIFRSKFCVSDYDFWKIYSCIYPHTCMHTSTKGGMESFQSKRLPIISILWKVIQAKKFSSAPSYMCVCMWVHVNICIQIFIYEHTHAQTSLFIHSKTLSFSRCLFLLFSIYLHTYIHLCSYLSIYPSFINIILSTQKCNILLSNIFFNPKELIPFLKILLLVALPFLKFRSLSDFRNCFRFYYISILSL